MAENSQIRTGIVLKLIGMVVVAGALVAGLMLPLVGGTGLAARNSASLLNIPVQLTDQAPVGNSKVLAADGSLITEFYQHNRTPVASDQIAKVMKQAQVDIEDSRFYEHNGIDVQGTLRALVANVAAGSVQEGGSTLTQQLVKQTLLQTATTPEQRKAATEETVGRKLREARLALAMEKKYTKDQILTRYLNTVYFGQGAYGIESAAETYFSVHAKDLTLPQAALLAGLVQSPYNYDPITHPDHALKRRNEVLARMHTLGHLSDKEYDAAVATPVQVQEGVAPPRGCAEASIAGYFCAYLHDYLTGKLGISSDQLDNGGLTIQTTLQPDLQRSADQSVLDHVAMGATFAGILDAVQPGTGHVLAMSVNRQYGCSPSQGPQCESVNLAVSPAQGSGSTYKVFTAAYALSQGFGAHYTILAPQPYTSKVYKGYRDGHFGPLVVSNDNSHYKSVYDMTGALVASSNTYFVALEDALGSVEGPVRTSQAMGMHYDNTVTQDSAEKIIKNEIGPFTLGYNATSPLDLSSAYATLAASGTRCDPTPVTKILDRNGQPLKDANGKPVDTGDHCKPDAISPAVARTLSQMLIGVVTGGTATSARIPGHDIAGKTGTTQNNKSAAFVGITPDYAVSVMYFDPKGKAFVGGVGGGVPARIFHDAMAPVLANQPNHPFPPADPAVEAGNGQHKGYVPPPPPPANPSPQNNAPPTQTQPPATDQNGGGGTGGTGGGGTTGTGGGGTGGGTGGGGTSGGRPAPGPPRP